MAAAEFAEINGVRLRHRVVGSGPTLVVQPPGWGVGAGIYEQTYLSLADDHSLIFVDTRGSGGSQRDVEPATINVGQFVDDLEGLRADLGIERMALTGHSHGGYIALNYALRFPSRLTHLILVDAQVGVTETGEDLRRTLPQRAMQPEYQDAVAAFREDRGLSTDEQFGERLQRVAPLYFHDVTKAAPLMEGVKLAPPAMTAFRAANASDGQFPVRDRLHEIQVPALVLVGRHDFICSPVQAQLLADNIPSAQLHIFEHSGHFPWIEEPEEFFTTMREFLDTQPG